MRAVCSAGRFTSTGQKTFAAAQIQFVRYARNTTRKSSPRKASKPIVRPEPDPMAEINAREQEMADDVDVSKDILWLATKMRHMQSGSRGDRRRLCLLRCHYLLFSYWLLAMEKSRSWSSCSKQARKSTKQTL